MIVRAFRRVAYMAAMTCIGLAILPVYFALELIGAAVSLCDRVYKKGAR